MIALLIQITSPKLFSSNRTDIEDDDKSKQRFCNRNGSEKWKMGDSRINERLLRSL